VRAELQAFLDGRTEWPLWDAFHTAGRASLHEQVILHCGTELWALRLGIAHSPGPTVMRIWTEERIRATLHLYLKDKLTWPTRTQFRADGLGQLRFPITRSGGVDRRVGEFGLPAPHHLRGQRVWWPDERLEDELRRFAADRKVFPTGGEFQRADQSALLGAVRRHGGTKL
jgi:hypothetical protein